MHIGLYYCLHGAAVAFSPNLERGLVRAFRKRSCGGRTAGKREGQRDKYIANRAQNAHCGYAVRISFSAEIIFSRIASFNLCSHECR